MPSRRALAVAAAAAVVLVGALVAPRDVHAASARFHACGQSGLRCTTVAVPLDRSGATPGTIQLYLEELPADGVQRGVMFLVAGGPGQASAEAFDLSGQASTYRNMFPGYTLVAFDNRGTGRSGLIDCPALQRGVSATSAEQARLAADCAALIGPSFQFYATRDHAEDLDAVRQAIGAAKVGIWGTSYGTKLAEAYALAHPDRVERLILDSVVLPEGSDPLGQEVLRAMPAGLGALCANNSCSAATPNVAADVATLANRLAAKPLSGKVPQPNGRTKTQRLDGPTFLSTVIDTDLNPGLAAELPAVVRAALRGAPRPLLRMVALDQQSSLIPATDLSFGLLAATNCDDGLFPWAPDTPVVQRPALLAAARAALPPGATGPFGTWATDIGTAALCVSWPSPAGGAPLGRGPLPDVPVLILSGDRDLRTPTASALAMAARFRHADVTIVPGVGHSVLTADFTNCASDAVATWLAGGTPPLRCDRVPLLVDPIPGLASSVRALAPLGGSGLPGRTLSGAGRTVREAGAAWTTLVGGFAQAPKSVAGPYGGTLRPLTGRPGFTLVRYSSIPGLELSGRLELDLGIFRARIPFRFVGTVTVGGARVAHGRLQVGRSTISGRLGGRRVSARS
jgi:pimeloyl-ACP methyl ester carboxylesterase